MASIYLEPAGQDTSQGLTGSRGGGALCFAFSAPVGRWANASIEGTENDTAMTTRGRGEGERRARAGQGQVSIQLPYCTDPSLDTRGGHLLLVLSNHVSVTIM